MLPKPYKIALLSCLVGSDSTLTIEIEKTILHYVFILQITMKVLLLGVTGRVGSRLLPALLAHKHQVVAYVRNPAKISPEATPKLDSIVVGSASDSAAIKAAILSHNCDAVVNAAGLAAMTSLTSQGEFPAIFAAVVKATLEAGRERGSGPIRCWFMSGFGILDSPKKPYLLLD